MRGGVEKFCRVGGCSTDAGFGSKRKLLSCSMREKWNELGIVLLHCKVKDASRQTETEVSSLTGNVQYGTNLNSCPTFLSCYILNFYSFSASWETLCESFTIPKILDPLLDCFRTSFTCNSRSNSFLKLAAANITKHRQPWTKRRVGGREEDEVSSYANFKEVSKHHNKIVKWANQA